MGAIYKITSPSGKLYVGKTYDLRKRINSHKCISKKETGIILYNSIKKYGWDAHVIEIIEEVDELLLNEREIFWIAELKTYCYENPKGLNMTRGGEGQRATWMHKTEMRKKYSEMFSGEGNPFYGKKHTEENKKAQSERAKRQALEKGTKVPKWGAEKGRLKVIKPVLLYGNDGLFIKEFESYTDGGAFIGIKSGEVWECVSGKRSHCKGYIFKEKTENYPLKISVEIKEKTVKRAVLWLSSDLKVLGEYSSAQEASDTLKVPKTTINRAAQYNWLKPIRSGHVFIYRDLYAGIVALTA